MIFPVKRSLKVFGTDSFDVSLTWKDPDDVPYLLSSWVARFTFFVSKDDRTVVKTVNSGGLLLGGTRIDLADVAPNIYVFVKASETQVGVAPDFLEVPGYYTLDLAPVDLGDTVYRLMEGKINYEL